jgi:hypothetical protein
MSHLRFVLLGCVLGFAATFASCGAASKACSIKTCPNGCCDESGSCQLGTSGATCKACGIQQSCQL